MAIDVGSSPIDRATYWGNNYTIILKENPANDSGKITQVEIFTNGVATVIAALFEKVNGDTFTARDSESLGSCPAGYSSHVTDLDVVAGDYIGFYILGSGMKRDDFGDGMWYLTGDHTSCVSQVFSSGSNRTFSTYGTGNGNGAVKPNWGQII